MKKFILTYVLSAFAVLLIAYFILSYLGYAAHLEYFMDFMDKYVEIFKNVI